VTIVRDMVRVTVWVSRLVVAISKLFPAMTMNDGLQNGGLLGVAALRNGELEPMTCWTFDWSA